MGLKVLINANVAEYYCSSTNSAGFKVIAVNISFSNTKIIYTQQVLLHNPIETPKISEYGFFISPGFESRIVITPKISDASTLIRNVPAKQRQCVFTNEGNLAYFRLYITRATRKDFPIFR